MKQKFLLGFFCLLLCFVCTACSNPFHSAQNTNAEHTLTILNYGKYIDERVLKNFEQETGISIKYEEYESPEEMYTKYKSGAIDYDLICTSEYIIQKLMKEGEVLEQDYASLSNYQNLDTDILSLAQSYDSKNTYTVPYFYGTVGILYDTREVSEEAASSWEVLWDETYQNELILLNSVRDAFIPALKLCGYSINESSEVRLREALSLLDRQFPIVYAYFVEEMGDEMISGNAKLALSYSGEAAYAMEFNENLAYTIPKEGSNVWIDSWFLPKTCKNQEAALQFINYLCEAENAQANFEYVHYASPITAVSEALDWELQNNEAILPSKESLSRCEIFTAIDDTTTALFNHLWQELKSRTVQ